MDFSTNHLLKMFLLQLLSCCLFLFPFECKVVNLLNQGAVPFDDSIETATSNTIVFNNTLADLQPYDTLLIPFNYSFWFNGGIYGTDLSLKI